MANGYAPGLNSTDLDSLLGKLETFAQGLEPHEREAFDTVLQQALIVASEGVEVSGYDYAAILPEGDLLHSFGLS